MGDKISVQDAGIIILTNFIPTLFERLGLTSEGEFTNLQSRQRAVLYLQYLSRGMQESEDNLLILYKILCGLDVRLPITEKVMITMSERNLIEKLIDGAIAYWPSIADSTFSRFRANWLMRDGQLKETATYWELTVEKKPYDILLSRSPYAFSAVKYPWMHKVLEVYWPY
ncbi:contractile injection system tape measure protein [Flavobacterium sp. ST-75]|uniref:Contractile injection system tape measure protein n=1 Tax=Flavobacterium rhizophilum TaxID=3163296 RepID=A0ABW8Y9B4_9FLAO